MTAKPVPMRRAPTGMPAPAPARATARLPICMSATQPALVVLCLLAAFAVAVPARAQSELPVPQGEVILTIEGAISRTNDAGVARFDREMLEDLPSAKLDTETVVTDGVHTFEGVLMRDLLERVGADGETVTASALNDYLIDIPVADFERFDVVAATRMDGEQLTPRDKGPIWIVYPRDDFEELRDIRYDYRWVWQLVHLEVGP